VKQAGYYRCIFCKVQTVNIMKAKKVSVIVPAYNAARTIARCIESLLGQNFPRRDFEIIVVDNNSTDTTAEIIKRYPVKYVIEKKRGPAAARNAGIAASKGSILAFIDSDCFARKDWLREGLAAFEDGVGCVAGRVLASEPENVYEKIIAGRDEFNVPEDYHGHSPYAITANVIFRREVFDAVGMFDTAFRAPAGEDVDICWRMLKGTAFTLKRHDGAVVFHKHRSTLKSYFRQYFNYGLYNQLLQKKFPEEFDNTQKAPKMAELISIAKQTLCIPKVFWMTMDKPDRKHTRALHLMNLARQSAFVFGRILGKLRVLTS